ncbi:sugar phosphate isomerase/epimerase family protein [Sphingobacterium faecium]|uniref:sugar phosphate isomerase/epimerase family protein n=1 Tax=Sphingobacterium faecium TaxID=34087 RepID=UPI001D173AE9|nr:sugar phosphate isomerase/epimerase [Sphingobacterium faecium]
MKYLYSIMLFVLWALPNQAQVNDHLKIKFYCTNWGMAESWDSYCARVSQAGFDGLETWLPAVGEERTAMFDALKKHKLSLGLLSGGGGANFEQYLASFTKNVEDAAQQKPDYINCHTGKEYYTFEQNKALIDAAESISKKTGIPIRHETHRGRFSFAAHITKKYLEEIPHLRLTLDISHWCNVHESMLSDQKEAVQLALLKTGHIHARVGHPQGPQVNDPAAPEWKPILDQHLAWWDEIVRIHKENKAKVLTITTEFGPSGYLPTLPYTQQPVADQWSINVFMLNLLKARYKS